MATTFVLAFVLQQLAVSPFPCEAGAELVVRAAAAGAPLVGLAIEAEWDGGGTTPLGQTDRAGELRIQPAKAGLHKLVARHDGVRLVAPMRIVPTPRRWLYVAIGVPLGLALLVWNLRGALRRST